MTASLAEPPILDLGAQSHLEALLATVGQVQRLRVIDIGCGEGQMTRALAALGAQVAGRDENFKAHQILRKDVGCAVFRRHRQLSIWRERPSELHFYKCIVLSQAGLYRQRPGAGSRVSPRQTAESLP